MATAVSGRFYLFGPYWLDRDSGQLSRDGRRVPITPKALALLQLLLDAPGRTLTREELQRHAWSGLSVSDKNLAVQMVAVRRALGDVSRKPIFVETVPRRGYRFIAQVRIESGGDKIGFRAPDLSLGHETRRPVPERFAVLAIAFTVGLSVYVAWTKAGDRSIAAQSYGSSPGTRKPGPSSTSSREADIGRIEAGKQTSANPEAQRLYLMGRYFWNKRTDDGLSKAIDYLDRAIKEDPSFARAYAALADCYAVLAEGRWPSAESFPKAAAAAEKALALDRNLAEAYVPLAFEKACYRWDWRGAEAAFRRGIELDPSYATAHQWYGLYLADLGRFTEAVKEATRAHELDPLSPAITATLGRIYYLARQYPLARKWAREALEIEPGFGPAHETIAESYWEEGAYQAWFDESLLADSLEGASQNRIRALRAAYATSGALGVLRARLVFLEAEIRDEYVSAFVLARAHAQLGQTEATLDWIERALEQRDSGLELLRVDPAFDRVRPQLRFQEAVRRTGLS